MNNFLRFIGEVNSDQVVEPFDVLGVLVVEFRLDQLAQTMERNSLLFGEDSFGAQTLKYGLGASQVGTVGIRVVFLDFFGLLRIRFDQTNLFFIV